MKRHLGRAAVVEQQAAGREHDTFAARNMSPRCEWYEPIELFSPYFLLALAHLTPSDTSNQFFVGSLCPMESILDLFVRTDDHGGKKIIFEK